jgi:apolipoprotein N-acyltransferase
MQERTKAQITIGLLAFFSSMWILIEQAKYYTNPLYVVGYILLLLAVMLILSYVIIALLEWIRVFELKVNAILTLIVLTSFMLSLTFYIILNST